jgi:signal transduction histidine kinase
MLLPALRRPSLADALLGAFYAVVVVTEAWTEPVVSNPAVHALVAGPAMAAVAWRRVYPLTVTAVVVVALVVLGSNGGGLSIAFGLLVMAFTVGSEVEGRRSVVALAVLLTTVTTALMADLEEAVAGDLAAAVTLVVVPWLAGRALRLRADHLARALAHAERLEVERAYEVERATAQERVRLARELHDVVSHSISVIAIQAQAVRRRLRPDQEREITDLTRLESAAREAMAEMRRLFGVLREEGEGVSLAPQPGLGELGRLAEQVRATGLDVDVRTEGEPSDLPPGLDLAAYRIVQEAVTNALRHSGGGRVWVRLVHRPGELEVVVEDDGRGLARAAEDGRRPGHGLRGIRERAELYGGTLDVGPGSRGGTRVSARLPVGVHA